VTRKGEKQAMCICGSILRNRMTPIWLRAETPGPLWRRRLRPPPFPHGSRSLKLSAFLRDLSALRVSLKFPNTSAPPPSTKSKFPSSPLRVPLRPSRLCGKPLPFRIVDQIETLRHKDRGGLSQRTPEFPNPSDPIPNLKNSALSSATSALSAFRLKYLDASAQRPPS
jgi:hypothetical protein